MKLFIIVEYQEFGIKKPLKHPNKNPTAILEVAFLFFSLVVLCQMDNTELAILLFQIGMFYWKWVRSYPVIPSESSRANADLH